MCDAAAILKLSLIMLSLGPTFRIRAPTVALDNSVSVNPKNIEIQNVEPPKNGQSLRMYDTISPQTLP